MHFYIIFFIKIVPFLIISLEICVYNVPGII